MFRHCQYFVGQARIKLLKLRQELVIEVLCNLIESMPLGEVRPHHGCAHPGPSSLMMPQLVVSPLYRFIKLGGCELPLFFELLHRCLCRLSELIIIEVDRIVVLLVEVLTHSTPWQDWHTSFIPFLLSSQFSSFLETGGLSVQ